MRVLVGACFACSVAVLVTTSASCQKRPSLPVLRDVSAAIVPVYDGHLSSVFVREGIVASFVSGEGQACYDGWLRLRTPSGELDSPDLTLGANSPWSKADVYNELPELVAVLDRNRFVFNLKCGAEFPKAAKQPTDSITWNVVLYEADKRAFRNLTRLSGADHRACRAIEWFPREGVLLVEQQIVPPEPTLYACGRAAELACLDLESGAWRPLTEAPEAQAYSVVRGQLLIQKSDPDADAREFRWSLGWKGEEGQVITIGPVRSGPSLVAVLDVNPPLAVVSHEACGTWLLDQTGRVRLRVSDDVAVNVDRQSRTVFLRSTARDGNGQYRYRALDARDFLLQWVHGPAGAETHADRNEGEKEYRRRYGERDASETSMAGAGVLGAGARCRLNRVRGDATGRAAACKPGAHPSRPVCQPDDSDDFVRRSRPLRGTFGYRLGIARR
jgi:hypothetical protein